jgi:nucleotide-binding universal stress UspA family protein
MTVLVGYLTTPEGEAAFETGLREATLRSTRLVVLNSPHQGAPVDAAMASDVQLRQLQERADAAGVELELRQTPHHEDLVDTLLTTATEVDATIIVIGLRRRSPVGKLFMGSTAQRLLLASELPVLSVKSVPR